MYRGLEEQEQEAGPRKQEVGLKNKTRALTENYRTRHWAGWCGLARVRPTPPDAQHTHCGMLEIQECESRNKMLANQDKKLKKRNQQDPWTMKHNAKITKPVMVLAYENPW